MMTSIMDTSIVNQGFDPQDWPTEISAIEKFIKTATDMIQTGDVKQILAQFITKFLQQLDSVTAILKTKQTPRLAIDFFKNLLITLIDENGVKLFEILKEVILVRQRDRSLREFSLRAVKRLFKIAGIPVSTMLYKIKIHIVICFILEREFKSAAVAKERLQCFRLMEAWLQVDPDSFPILFAQATVSLVRNEEETQLRHSAIGLMSEMCNKNPKVAAQVGAIKRLIDCLLDLSLEGFRYETISQHLMLLINNPKIRCYFRPQVDLNKIFSIFTRADGTDTESKKPQAERVEAQMKLAQRAIVNMMRSWQGVIYFTSSNLGLSSLVEALNQPIKMQKKIAILDIFIDIFNVPIFLGGSESNSTTGDYMLLGGFGKSDNLLNNYIALLLQAFHYCGAYDALTMLGTTAEEGSQLNRKSKAFLKNIIYLSSNLLPEVPHFPQLIHIATDFTAYDQHSTRTRATKLVKELSTVALRNPLEFNQQSELMRGSNLGPNDFSQLFMNTYDYMVQVKLGLPQTQIFSNNLVDLKAHYYQDTLNDEQKFQKKVKDTKILTEKNWEKWNWEIILELLEGNLITQPRLEALYKNKFTKRLLKFYLPEKQAFIKLAWTEENLKYAKCGYLLIKRLVHDKRGRRVLSSEEELIQFLGIPFYEQHDQLFQLKRTFMQSIQELLKSEVQYCIDRNQRKNKQNGRQTASPGDIDYSASRQSESFVSQAQSDKPLSSKQKQGEGIMDKHQQKNSKFGNQIGASSSQRWFTKERMNETMTRELISWLGLLSNEKKGQKLLKKFGIYEYLEKLIDLDGYYDHLILLMLNSFLFSTEELARKMLMHWSANASTLLSKNILEYFRLIYRSEYFFYDWCLPLLMQQAACSDRQVSAMAFDVLEEACQDESSLNLLLNKTNGDIHPDFIRQGDSFVARFMRSEQGFDILLRKGWVADKMNYWYEIGNYQYISFVEQSMYNGLSLNEVGGHDSDYALQIWIPIFEHSNDYRQELALLKRFPFQVMLKMESPNLQEKILERMQTYFDIGHNNEIQIVGRLVPGHTRAGRISLEELGDGYISVAPKLGATYVDSKCKANETPSWTLSQIDKQVRERLARNPNQRTFYVMKDGISFVFQKNPQAGQSNNILSQFYLDSVIYRVKILPEKHKTIKNPTHFYGELVKTKKGAEYLRQKKHLEQFKADILNKDAVMLKKRAALWAIGHIGSNENGIKLVLEQELVQPLIKLAEQAETLSLRGTCIYIIGMLSNTAIGRSAIQKHGWICSKTKGITAVCLPREPKTIFHVAPYKFEGNIGNDDNITYAFNQLKKLIPCDHEEEEILKNIANLLNGVYEVQAIAELRKKQETPEVFLNPKVFEHMLLLLQVYRFRPKGRKFIWCLFESLIFSNQMDKQVYYLL